MKLKFECKPYFEPLIDGIKAVGQYRDADGRDQFVVCQVARDALEYGSSLHNATGDALILAFQTVQDEFTILASVQFAAGVSRPLVTKEDLVRLRGIAIA
jgi:hypothetical protein